MQMRFTSLSAERYLLSDIYTEQMHPCWIFCLLKINFTILMQYTYLENKMNGYHNSQRLPGFMALHMGTIRWIKVFIEILS